MQSCFYCLHQSDKLIHCENISGEAVSDVFEEQTAFFFVHMTMLSYDTLVIYEILCYFSVNGR